MPLIIPPGYLQAVYELTLSGDTEVMVVTMGHEIDGASGATGADAPDDLFGAFATNIVAPLMANSYSLLGVTVYSGNDGPPNVYVSTEPPVAGGNSAPVLPPNSAFLIRKRTDLAGRRGRGRMYIPGVQEGQANDVGIVPTSTVDLWQAALDDWYENLTALIGGRLYPPVVLHRSEGLGVEPLPTPITRLTIEGKIATQRRRLRP